MSLEARAGRNRHLDDLVFNHDPRRRRERWITPTHSLRAGCVPTCVETNAPLLKIAEVTRHKSLSMLQVYNRRHNLFADHAAASWV